MNGAEVAPIVAHIERLLGLLATERVAKSVRDSSDTSRTLHGVIVSVWNASLEHGVGRARRRNVTVLHLDIVVCI